MKHACHFGLITLTRPRSLCAYFIDACSGLPDSPPLFFGMVTLLYHNKYPGSALLEN